ncbi:MAG: putative exported protein [Pseudomonadota bacterium]
MKKINALLLLVGLLVSTGASAVEIIGAPPCENWVKARNENNSWLARVFQGWLVGYLSGLAVGRDKDVLGETDSSSIDLWMDNYCKANPLKDVGDGGIYLYFELVKQKHIK